MKEQTKEKQKTFDFMKKLGHFKGFKDYEAYAEEMYEVEPEQDEEKTREQKKIEYKKWKADLNEIERRKYLEIFSS